MTLSVTLGNLDLHDVDNYFIDRSANPATWLQADGVIRFPVFVQGSSAANCSSKRRAIQSEINRAETVWRSGIESERVSLDIDLQTGTTVSFHVRTGTVRTIQRHVGGRSEVVEVSLICDAGPAGAGAPGRAVGRLAPDVRTVSGTLTNGSAKVLLDGVQGDRIARTRIALTDVSTSGVINRFRLSLLSGESVQLSDWNPWVDVVNAGSANQSDGSPFGGSYERVSLSSATAWTYLGRAVMPAGAAERGWRGLYLRLRDHAVVTPAPTGLGSSIDAPAVPGDITLRQMAVGSGTGTQVSASWGSATQVGNVLALEVKAQNPPAVPPPAITRRQGGGTNNTGTAPARTWGSSTLSGSLLVMTLRFGGDMGDWTPPEGWTVAISEPGTDVNVALLFREGASVESGSESGGSFAISVAWSMYTAEHINAATSGALIGVLPVSDDAVFQLPAMSLATPATLPHALFVSVAGSSATGPFDSFSWSNSFVSRFNGGSMGVGERVVSASGTYTTVADFVGAANVAGLLVAFAAAEQVSEPPVPIAMTPPAGYALAGFSPNLDDPDKPLTTALFYRQNAPATTGAQAVTFSTSVIATVRLIEWVGLATENALADVVTAVSDGAIANMGPTAITDQQGTLAIAVFGAYGTATGWSGWSGGFTNAGTANGLSAAYATSGVLQAWSAAAAKSAVDAGAHILAVFRQALPGDESPGDLQPGTYPTRIRAVNAGGAAGTASGTHNAVVSLDGSAAVYSWSAAATTKVSEYELEISFDGVTYIAVTNGAVTSFRLESLAGLPQAAFGASDVAPNLIQVQVGTDDMSASTALLRNDAFEIVHTGTSDADLLGQWYLHAAALTHLPPQQQMFDGGQPGWAVEAFGRNAGGPAANMDLDSLIVLSDESGMVLEYPGLGLTTQRVWLAEVRRDGSVVAWLEDGAGNQVGPVRPIGRLRPSPGDSLLSIVMEQAGGVLNVGAAQCTAQITLYPEVDWTV